MPSLADLRSRHAATFHLTAASWKNFQSELAPVLGMGIVGDRVTIDTSPGFQVSPPATPEDCGLLILAAMLRGVPSTIARRVLLRWHAQISGAAKCPITGAQHLHEAMTAVLRLPELAQRLDHLEVTREFAAVGLFWADGAQSIFETADPADMTARQTIMGEGRLFTVAMLGGAVFRDIASWLAADPEPAPARRERAEVQ